MRRMIRFLTLTLAALILAVGCQNQADPKRSAEALNGVWIQSQADGTVEGEQIIEVADGRGSLRLVFYDDPDDDSDDELAQMSIIFTIKVLEQKGASVFIEVTDTADSSNISRLEYKFLSDDRIESIYEASSIFLDRKK